MTLEARNLVTMMINGNFIDADGAKESIVIQELRIAVDPSEFIEICKGVERSGSWYAIPTLMALFKIKEPYSCKIAISNALEGIRSRLVWDSAFVERLFKLDFWKINWKASMERYLSFITIILNISNNVDNETLANNIICETDINISPYSTFGEMKVACKNWHFEKDLKEVISNAFQEASFLELIREMDLPESLETQFKRAIVGMKSDYLITILQLGVQYKELHIGISMAQCLNCNN
ncbi:MAG: hypothetical protein EOO90_21040 [Pedobacter sp.]|nr:MAG: hypothetical protein EOO90_21040 [Pedobacter sp.]